MNTVKNPQDCKAVLEAVHQIAEDRWQAMVTVEQQTIGFGPLCDSEEECWWWCRQFQTALAKAGARFLESGTWQWEQQEQCPKCGAARTYYDGWHCPTEGCDLLP